MMQPKWKLLSSTDYSAVFVDKTGKYPAEMVVGVEDQDTGSFDVFRFPLEPFKVVKKDGRNYLVPAALASSWAKAMTERMREEGVGRPYSIYSYEPWFVPHLDAMARTAGVTKAELISNLTSTDPMALSAGYEIIGQHFGFQSLDHYPTYMSGKKLAATLKGRKVASKSGAAMGLSSEDRAAFDTGVAEGRAARLRGSKEVNLAWVDSLDSGTPKVQRAIRKSHLFKAFRAGFVVGFFEGLSERDIGMEYLEEYRKASAWGR